MKKANKKLASAIVLGLMLAVPFSASAAEGIINNKADGMDLTIGGNLNYINDEYVYGARAQNGGKITLEGNSLNLTVESTVNAQAHGIMAGAFKGNTEEGVVSLGDKDTEQIVVNVTSKGFTSGLSAYNQFASKIDGGQLTVNGKYLEVNTHSDDDVSYGLWTQNSTNSTPGNDGTYIDGKKVATLEINADKTIVNVTSGNPGYAVGMAVFSQSKLVVNGDLEVNADTVLSTRGESVVKINESGNNTVKLNGDIEFSYNDATSKTTIDADVTINLTDSESYLNGNIGTASDIEEIPNDKKDVFGMKLGLSNGAQWTTDANSFVNTLTFNDGIININGGKDHTVQLDKVEGTGGTVNIKAEIEDGSVTSGKLNIGKKAEETVAANALLAKNTIPKLDVNFTGITADSFENVNAAKNALNDLAGNVSVTGGEQISATANIKEGIVSGAVSGEMTFTNDGGAGSVAMDNIKVNDSTTTMDNMRDIASVALVAWRQEDSTLSQRLGELRSSEGDQGIWARMSRGEFEYGGAFKNQYNYFQLGYDKAYGDWHYGAAISHNDGQTTYAQGSGENDSTSLTLYGTWLGNEGKYADIVVKQGKLNNEFTNYAEAGTTTGDYDMWGTSISAEYGQKLEMKNDWYVTPQAQLTYMRIGGEDYTATVTKDGKSAPMQVSQDGMDSFVGRIGFEAGKNISEKGSIYAKASLLHEFAGEADTTLLYGEKYGTYSQDLGDTWYECGFGVNYKTSDNSYVYADVVKTFGGDVETPWQWNAGMRFTF